MMVDREANISLPLLRKISEWNSMSSLWNSSSLPFSPVCRSSAASRGEPRFHVDRRVSGGRGRCGRLDGEAQFGEGAQLLLTVCGVQLPMDDLSAERVPLLDRLGDEPDASTDGDDFGCFEAFRDFACHGSRDVEPALELGVPTTATAAALYSRQASRGGADDILRVVSTMRAQFGGHVTRA